MGIRPSAGAEQDAEALARRFHETYERLAPAFGYETRKASAVPWEDVPERNRALMVAVASELLSAGAQVPADTIVRDRLARALMWLDPVALAEDEDVALNQAREAIRAALAVRTPEEQVQEEDS